MSVLDRLEELRKEKGITKVFLASTIGRKSQIFQDWKEGKSRPNDEQIRLLASALGTTPEYLTGKTDEKTEPAEKRTLSEDDIKYAFFGGDAGIMTEEDMEDVRKVAAILIERRKRGQT